MPALPTLAYEEVVMTTKVALDPELVDRAFALSGESTKRAAVTLAVQEFIARREQLGLLDLFGTLEWDEVFDSGADRTRS
jgi:Arc/MetJ family transcription regulator